MINKEIKDRVVEELVKAFVKFNVYDEMELNKRIKSKLDGLKYATQETIVISGEKKTGYLLHVAMKDNEEDAEIMHNGNLCFYEKTKILYLFVGDCIEFVLETADTYISMKDGSALSENIVYEQIALDDIVDKYYAALS